MRILTYVSHLSKFGRAAIAVAATMATLFGVVTFFPGIIVDPVGNIDPAKPSGIRFVVSNNNLYSLRNVQPMLCIEEIWTGEPKNLEDRLNGPIPNRLIPLAWFTKKLDRDEKLTILLEDAYPIKPPAKFGGARISILVEYQTWIFPFKKFQKEFRFFTRIENDGQLSWLSRPLTK